MQSNETNSEKIEELNQALNEELNNNQESLQELLNKQTELYQLKKHLTNLQVRKNEQQAQIFQPESKPWTNNS